MSAGKGSVPRPFSVDDKTYTKNWEATFQRKTNGEDSIQPPRRDLPKPSS